MDMTATRNHTDGTAESPALRASIGSLLADETRIRILRELYAARPSDEARDGLQFSTLRRRVGVADSGRFNYHLDQLTDELVTKTDGRYVLTPVGERLVGALVEPAPS